MPSAIEDLERASTGRTQHQREWPETENHKVPSKSAQFRGSLVLKHVESPHDQEPPLNKARASEWVTYFKDGWDNVGVWKSAFIEMVATGLLCYLSGLIGTTIMNFDTKQAPVYAAVADVFLLTLFIFAGGPGSGGHVNQTITFSTMITGLTGFSRGVLYLCGQTVGSIAAGGVLRGVFGHERSIAFHGGGCFIDQDTISTGQALLIEIVSCWALLFLAFGLALDPRQAKVMGMAGPVAVGCALGLIVFAGAGLVPGYPGASMHPGRCLSFAISRWDFADQWIWWVGPVAASFLHSIVFRIAPPYHSTPVPDPEMAKV